jgi:hypothetical protein
LNHAFGEILQALFIKRRVYPIADNKWIRETEIFDLNKSSATTGLSYPK